MKLGWARWPAPAGGIKTLLFTRQYYCNVCTIKPTKRIKNTEDQLKNEFKKTEFQFQTCCALSWAWAHVALLHGYAWIWVWWKSSCIFCWYLNSVSWSGVVIRDNGKRRAPSQVSEGAMTGRASGDQVTSAWSQAIMGLTKYLVRPFYRRRRQQM